MIAGPAERRLMLQEEPGNLVGRRYDRGGDDATSEDAC